MASSNSFSSNDRPILPPLHTLNLPQVHISKLRRTASDEKYDPYDYNSTVSEDSDKWSRPRQPSASSTSSSSFTTSSREASPSDDQVPSLSRNTSRPTNLRRTITLVPTSFDEANAVVYIPPPLSPSDKDASNASKPPAARRPQRPLLLVGPAVEQFRHPSRRIANGARVHPYKVILNGRPKSNSSRRTSMSSNNSEL